MADPLVVVTGANGLVGARVCAALLERGAAVRAIVRRPGTAPAGVEEVVGDFTDTTVLQGALAGADAVVTTVHPMGSDRATQEQIGVEGNARVARAAADAGVDRLVHVSTTAVYDRRPHVGDIDETSALVPDDGADYAVTKRDTDAAIAAVDGLTRVLVRPPAILGPSEASVWNTLRPAAMRDDETARHAVPDEGWPWVHVDDLAAFLADLAVAGRRGGLDEHDHRDEAGRRGGLDELDHRGTGDHRGQDAAEGPVPGRCTPVNLPAGNGTQRDYYETVTGALGVEPVWDDGPAWTGRISDERARSWGWVPTVERDAALAELAAGLR